MSKANKNRMNNKEFISIYTNLCKEFVKLRNMDSVDREKQMKQYSSEQLDLFNRIQQVNDKFFRD